ncbi:MAG: DNA mismatch repair endonuclease MutL [Gemmatimonadales bacterium]|nr:DNA mismatch repair endonuclease MutL [Gemmatimonadales bacterium]
MERVMARRRIAILPDNVSNRIAAGEVVERPASVVKELLENALDAGARAIAVEIESGGKSLIRLADDGEGMAREDALLALDRHATSKVRTADDLVGVATFGFRGEALPSIAAVSRFEMETATDDEPVGTRIASAGGLVSAVEDVTRQRGTTVTVRSLFYNTPARRKFLRSARSEARACADVVTTLALTMPALGLTLLADARRVVEALPATSLGARVAQLLGHRLAATLVPVEWEQNEIRVSGLAQRPADAAPGGRSVYLLVNGRPFRDHFLVRAAERGYRATVPAGSRPSLVLALSVPAADVDVNVHPAKLEVRFRDRFAVEAAVEEALHRALGELVAAARFGSAALPWEHRAVPLPSYGAPDASLHRAASADLFAGGAGEATTPAEPATGVADEEVLPRESGAPPAIAAAGLRLVAQIHQAYLLVESAQGLLIVDQHSAHERILYERTMGALESGGAASQKLLFPLTIEFQPAELDAIDAHRELLERLGFELEPFGGRAIAVQAAPAPHPRFDAERCLREVVADLAGNRFGGLANRLERFAATFACRAAIKAGQPLTREEMDELVRRLFSSELPAHDVHGRPTIVQLPLAELERRFGRR